MKPGEPGYVEPVETPVEPVVVEPVVETTEPVVAAVEPVVPPVVTPATVTRTVEQVETDLAASLVTMEGLQAQIGALQGTSQAVQSQRQELFDQLTGEIAKREELTNQLTATTGKLEAASQATQTLLTEKNKVEVEAAASAQKAATAEARALKLEIMVEEFPSLTKYATYIPASEDPAVIRAACEEFQRVRSADLDSYRQTLGGVASMTTVPTGNPGRTPEPVTPTDLAAYLESAFNDPQEFERRLASSKQNYEVRRGSS